jgi:hypothetical protein
MAPERMRKDFPLRRNWSAVVVRVMASPDFGYHQAYRKIPKRNKTIHPILMDSWMMNGDQLKLFLQSYSSIEMYGLPRMRIKKRFPNWGSVISKMKKPLGKV